jgi:transcriptional regulator with XRE-family HTH domain
MTTTSAQNELGRAIRIARRAGNLSQSEIAARTRRAAILRLPMGARNHPAQDQASAPVAQTFGTTLTRLLIPEEAAAGAAHADREFAAARTPAPPPDSDTGGSSQLL